MPKITFSKHARYQLRERNIPRKKVVDSFKNPDKIVKQSDKRTRLVKEIERAGKKYLLIIIFDQKDSIKEVITVFITSKIRKYL